MLKKIMKFFEKQNQKTEQNEIKKENYLSDIWAVTSTYYNLEEYLNIRNNSFLKNSYNYDSRKNIFEFLVKNLRINFKVTTLKELNSEFNNLNENKIVKSIYYDGKLLNNQLELTELLIHSILVNGCIHDNFLSYIENINIILKKNGLLYSDSVGKIIEINNLLQKENIESLFPLLSKEKYGQTNELLIKAVDEYNKGNYDYCVINTGKATETLMKCICQRRKYIFDPQKTNFFRLFEILNENNFFRRDDFIDKAPINVLVESFKVGLPKHRNDSAHGSSLEQKNTTKYIAKLSIDLTISYLHYFVSLDEKL